MIPNRWYLDADLIDRNNLLQQYPSILVCGTMALDNSVEFENRVDFHHFFRFRLVPQVFNQMEIQLKLYMRSYLGSVLNFRIGSGSDQPKIRIRPDPI